jgi:hypothetical protein
MPYKEVWVEDADLEDFDEDDLIDELERRGYLVMRKGTGEDLLFKVRQAYILDTPDNFRKFIARFLSENGHDV